MIDLVFLLALAIGIGSSWYMVSKMDFKDRMEAPAFFIFLTIPTTIGSILVISSAYRWGIDNLRPVFDASAGKGSPVFHYSIPILVSIMLVSTFVIASKDWFYKTNRRWLSIYLILVVIPSVILSLLMESLMGPIIGPYVGWVEYYRIREMEVSSARLFIVIIDSMLLAILFVARNIKKKEGK